MGPLSFSKKDQAKERGTESLWDTYFSENGRGACMFRMKEAAVLAQTGLPEKYRAEIWLLFSGAMNEVS